MSNAIETGHYARKQLFCQSHLIGWSHRKRFEIGIRLAKRFAGQRLLDYGCGDGTFLAMLSAERAAPAVGAEIDDGQVNDCRARFGDDGQLSFVRIESLNPTEHTHAFDSLVCMEVLEHVVDPEPIFARWRWLVVPGGFILVSVPVETGVALAFKQAARRVAGWRGIGDYPGLAPYRWSELVRGVFAGSRQHIERPVHRGADGSEFHCHKGFNWRTLRSELAKRFHLQETVGSPLPWLPAGLGSQVWFVLRNQ
jgi:SAM-dependent methyltransferase